jgi:hypothetical protein
LIGITTLGSIGLALVLAAGLGVLLGRVATQWVTGRALTNLLMDIRGAFLPFLLAPVVAETWALPPWMVVGLIIGFMQAISVSRWIARRSGEWSPALLGGIALGRSRAALVARGATARGAVVGTLAATTMRVIGLEASLAAVGLPGISPRGSIGARLYFGTGAELLLVLAVCTGAIVLTELGSSWLFQTRPRTSKS